MRPRCSGFREPVRSYDKHAPVLLGYAPLLMIEHVSLTLVEALLN